MNPGTNASIDLSMRDITALIAGLRDPAIRRRQAAAQELGRSGNPAATEPLGTALSDAHPKVRSACVQALGRLGEPAASPFLIRALDDTEYPALKTLMNRSGPELLRCWENWAIPGPLNPWPRSPRILSPIYGILQRLLSVG
jgi:hypothetical protein